MACLIPLDVGIRRIQLDWYVIRGWLGLGRKEGPSTAVMGALLERKQAVGSELQARKGETYTPPSRPRTAPATRRSKPPQRTTPTPQPNADKKPTGQGGEGGSTTSRLLEMKRKRQEEKEDDE